MNLITAATQQLTGRRTSSLKASFEAINMGVQTHEFSIGKYIKFFKIKSKQKNADK